MNPSKPGKTHLEVSPPIQCWPQVAVYGEPGSWASLLRPMSGVWPCRAGQLPGLWPYRGLDTSHRGLRLVSGQSSQQPRLTRRLRPQLEAGHWQWLPPQWPWLLQDSGLQELLQGVLQPPGKPPLEMWRRGQPSPLSRELELGAWRRQH